MNPEKIVATVLWSAVSVVAAMLADYSITVIMLHDAPNYTPYITLSIATVVTVPVTYALISGRSNLKRIRDELVVARDVADLANRKAHQALASAEVSQRKAELDREAAIAADKSKTQFLANMSHELRTPLNAILGFSQLLALDAFAEKRVEYATLIHGSGAHLLGLVNDLLDLSRIEAGQLELECKEIDLAALVEECLASVAPRAREGGLTLTRTIEPGFPLIRGDVRALRQILLNLLTNAIKFSLPGGSVDVFVHMGDTKGCVFGVTDTGIGIAEDDIGRVFERFGQGRHDVSVQERGAGLGLPIVRSLVEAHDGHVAITSRLGSGTCVTVQLPAARLAQIRDGIRLSA